MKVAEVEQVVTELMTSMARHLTYRCVTAADARQVDLDKMKLRKGLTDLLQKDPGKDFQGTTRDGL